MHEGKNLTLASTLDGFIHIFDHRTSDSIKHLTGNNCCINDFLLTK